MTEGTAAEALACCLAMGWYVSPVCAFYWLGFLEWGKVMLVHGFRYLLALRFGAWGESENHVVRLCGHGSCLPHGGPEQRKRLGTRTSLILPQHNKFPQSPNIPHIDESVRRLIRGWSQSLYVTIISPKPQVAATGRPDPSLNRTNYNNNERLPVYFPLKENE